VSHGPREGTTPEVVVAEPYLEMHSGPGRGYPVVYVVGRDEVVTVLYSRNRIGTRCARRAAGRLGAPLRIGFTKLASGEPAPIRPIRISRPTAGRLARGYGVFNHQNLVTTWGDFGLTEQPRRRIRPATGVGHHRQPYIASLGMRHTFIPEWRWFCPRRVSDSAISTSTIKYRRKPLQTSNQLAYVSLGVRGFITRRFMWRADWRKYVVFTNQIKMRNRKEWKFGLAVFF